MADKKDIENNDFYEIEEKIKWLGTAIKESIIRTWIKKNVFRRNASLIKISTIIVTGLITILLGFFRIFGDTFFSIWNLASKIFLDKLCTHWADIRVKYHVRLTIFYNQIQFVNTKIIEMA